MYVCVLPESMFDERNRFQKIKQQGFLTQVIFAARVSLLLLKATLTHTDSFCVSDGFTRTIVGHNDLLRSGSIRRWTENIADFFSVSYLPRFLAGTRFGRRFQRSCFEMAAVWSLDQPHLEASARCCWRHKCSLFISNLLLQNIHTLTMLPTNTSTHLTLHPPVSRPKRPKSPFGASVK